MDVQGPSPGTARGARRDAVVFALAGSVFLVHGLVAPWLYVRGEPDSVEVLMTAHLALTAVLLLACIVLVMTFPAVLALFRAKAPRLTAVTSLLVVPGVVLYVGVVFFLLFGFPFLAQKAPDVLDAEVAALSTGGGSPPMLAAFILGHLPFKIGLVLLGVTAIVAGGRSRAPGIVLVLALPVAAVHNQLLPWDFLGAWAVTGLGLAWLGVVMAGAPESLPIVDAAPEGLVQGRAQ